GKCAYLVFADFTAKYQTSNLGVGGSNPSERAKPSVRSGRSTHLMRSRRVALWQETGLVRPDRFDFAIEFGPVNRAPSAATAPFCPSATIPLSATHFCYSHREPLQFQWENARSWCRRFHPQNRTRDRPGDAIHCARAGEISALDHFHPYGN